MGTYVRPKSLKKRHNSGRHARACRGHPRLLAVGAKDVDGRNKSGHDGREPDGGNAVAERGPYGREKAMLRRAILKRTTVAVSSILAKDQVNSLPAVG
jgi:hypothetical protein